MIPAVYAWIRKADGDFRSMILVLKNEDRPNFDLICFLAQQCIEKLIKAYLTLKDIPFPKSHNLVKLSQLLEPRELEKHEPALRLLSEFASDFRYPNEFATKAESDDAVQACIRMRDILMKLLDINESDLFD